MPAGRRSKTGMPAQFWRSSATSQPAAAGARSPRFVHEFSVDRRLPLRRPGQNFLVFGCGCVKKSFGLVSFSSKAGGTIEGSFYPPDYANTDRDYERYYQEALSQDRKAASGCKPCHGRGDRKRERGFSGLRLCVLFIDPFFDLSLLSLPSASSLPLCLCKIPRY